MAKSYNDPQAPKNFDEAAKKIALNAFMACVLSLVIYMSILFVFRSIGNPKIIGYTEFEIILDDKGNAAGAVLMNMETKEIMDKLLEARESL